ncbi:hypothetical protein [Marinicella rhabdoformis]|uniref:hypothetical protein n=1 Tax=Marinicella rhabdoformis TaxID=2580566 RepID=UPI0012AEC955|nr:hypothetical protein [Marinicella rhabdoformis]
MNQSKQIDNEFLNPKELKDVTKGLLFIGKQFSEYSWPNLEPILIERLGIIKNIDNNLAQYTRLTYLSVVLFFSYVDGVAMSTKKLLLNSNKRGILRKISNKQRITLEKKDRLIGFEDLMKVQFSILPQMVGLQSEYGHLKQHSLPNLFKLRDIRNRIVHPLSLPDMMSVDLTFLEGKDINIAMQEFMNQLAKTLADCVKQLVPPENIDKVDLDSWFRKRQFDLE